MSAPLRSILLACAMCLCLPSADAAKATSKRRVATEPGVGALYGSRPDVMRLADDIAERRGLDRDWVRAAIGQSRHLPQVARWVLPAASPSAKNWRVYRSRFIDPVRIGAGVAFWQANAGELERAEQVYGVPAEIIVGIIGVETIYGRNTGNFRVMDALTTLAFDFPKAHPRASERSSFFLGELEQLLSLAQRTSSDPMGYKGSYAGAMGMPQFMPSSWVRYAIDFDGDGRIDLFDSPADVIGSVAHYFQSFGWQKGMPTHFQVQFDKSRLDLDSLLAPDILPTFSVDSFTAKGVILDADGLRHGGALALVELFNGDAPPSYLAGTENFYVITRYNWSSYYALAVIELGQEIAAARTSRQR